MRALHALALLGCVMAGVGCSSDPCDGEKGACISATIKGSAHDLDRLLISFDGAAAKQTPATAGGTFGLPVQVAIVPPSGTTGTHRVEIVAQKGATPIAATYADLALVGNSHVRHTFELDESVGLTDGGAVADAGAVDGGSDGGSSGGPVTIEASGNTNGVELTPLTLQLTVTVPAGGTPAITVDNTTLTGATLTQPNGTTPGGFSWTPRYNDAGSYTLTFTASDGKGHTAATAVTLTIANGADPAPPLFVSDQSTPDLPVNIIGDFDGDGYGDLAQCAITASGGTATYEIDLLYGNKDGLPTTATLPPGRQSTYTFSATSAAQSNPRAHCSGADVDGDGKSDILFADPGAGNLNGQVWIVFGQARSANTTPGKVLPAMPAPATAEQLGKQPLFVGDFNGDGIADFATETLSANATGDNIYVVLGQKPRPSGAAFGSAAGGTVIERSLTSFVCGTRILQGFGDIDGDGKDELLVTDPNAGATSSTCATSGGIDLLHLDSSADFSYVRPNGAGGLDHTWGSKQGWAVLCDVDDSGAADIVGVDDVTGKATMYYAPFAAGGLPAIQYLIESSNGRYGSGSPVICAKHLFGKSSLLLAAVNNGTTSVDVIGTTAPPLVVDGLPTPLNAMSGQSIGASGDVNGDGKLDILIGAPLGKYWVVYGR